MGFCLLTHVKMKIWSFFLQIRGIKANTRLNLQLLGFALKRTFYVIFDLTCFGVEVAGRAHTFVPDPQFISKKWVFKTNGGLDLPFTGFTFVCFENDRKCIFYAEYDVVNFYIVVKMLLKKPSHSNE